MSGHSFKLPSIQSQKDGEIMIIRGGLGGQIASPMVDKKTPTTKLNGKIVADQSLKDVSEYVYLPTQNMSAGIDMAANHKSIAVTSSMHAGKSTAASAKQSNMSK